MVPVPVWIQQEDLGIQYRPVPKLENKYSRLFSTSAMYIQMYIQMYMATVE